MKLEPLINTNKHSKIKNTLNNNLSLKVYQKNQLKLILFLNLLKLYKQRI